jgi:hypothetical protein
VLQIALGWQNCHPFEFRVGETAWGLLDRDDPDSSPLSAETATLADVLSSPTRSATTTCMERIGRTR